MRYFSRGTLLIAFLAAASTADAQFRPAPNGNNNQPPARTQAIVRTTNNVVQSPFNGGGYGFPGYVGAGWGNSYNGFLTGASDVINAQGNFLVSKRQSQVIQQQAEQASLDTQKKAYQQWQWEQSQAITLNDVREQAKMEALRRDRNNPPQTEIWSGSALNTLLNAVQRDQAAAGVQGPTVPLEESMVRAINVTTGATSTTHGSLGMVKNGKLEWPTVLTESQFDDPRGEVDRQLNEAIRQVMGTGRATGDAIASLRAAVDRLRTALRAQVAEMGSNDYMRGVSYINQLRDAISQLSAPNSARFLDGSMQIRANTMSELVNQMTTQGLRFAPVTAGQEGAYNALYIAMIAYDAGLSRMTRRGPNSFATGGPGPGQGPGGP